MDFFGYIKIANIGTNVKHKFKYNIRNIRELYFIIVCILIYFAKILMVAQKKGTPGSKQGIYIPLETISCKAVMVRASFINKFDLTYHTNTSLYNRLCNQILMAPCSLYSSHFFSQKRVLFQPSLESIFDIGCTIEDCS